MSKFPALFTPLSIKDVTLRNRIAISGHFASWWVEEGIPGSAFAACIEERVKHNGAGLFVPGATSPMPGSGWMESVSDAIIPHYEKFVQTAHRHGAAIFAQTPGTPVHTYQGARVGRTL
jgi:2,4-dienoyl-CoA reductase-like NADH-dependent reductase (Old Yellow Enzyme family)